MTNPVAPTTSQPHPEHAALPARRAATPLRRREDDKDLVQAALEEGDARREEVAVAAADGAVWTDVGPEKAAASTAAAEPSAMAGAGAGGAAAAEPSATTGAGVPLVAAAGGGLGGGTAALAGAGVLGLAAAGGGGGGGDGGGGGSSTIVPTATPFSAAGGTPTPTPTPTPAGTPTPAIPTIASFSEYQAQVSAAGPLPAATQVNATDQSTIEISNGFGRSLLPTTLDQLRPSLTYVLTGAGSTTSITDGGLNVNVGSGMRTTVHAFVDSTAGQSRIEWMQAFSLTGTSAADSALWATARAHGTNADAELGVQHYRAQFTGAGGADQIGLINVKGEDGGRGSAFFGDITMTMASSGVNATTPIVTQLHMGPGAGMDTAAGIEALAIGAGSTGTLKVAGDVQLLTTQADENYTFLNGIFADGRTGGAASVDIGGDVLVSSNAHSAHTYLVLDGTTDGAAGSSASVHVHGDAGVHSVGSDAFSLGRMAFHTTALGSVDVDGTSSVTVAAPVADGYLQLLSRGSGHIQTGAVKMSLDGRDAGHGWVDLFTDHAGGLDIGSFTLELSAHSQATVNVQHVNNATTDPANSFVDGTFLAHDASTIGVSIASASITGIGGASGGDVHLNLNGLTFGSITQNVNLLDLHYQVAELNSAFGSAPVTTIHGFSGVTDDVVFNSTEASAANFNGAVGTFSTLSSLSAAIETALDGTHKYVFAVYNGTEDINHNGAADDQNMGVLAWDGDGSGVSALLMLPGVTSLSSTDIA